MCECTNEEICQGCNEWIELRLDSLAIEEALREEQECNLERMG